jgi:hypothetical protein
VGLFTIIITRTILQIYKQQFFMYNNLKPFTVFKFTNNMATCSYVILELMHNRM